MEIGILVDHNLDGCPGLDWLENLVKHVLVAQGFETDIELGLVIASQDKVKALNMNYLGRDEPTDVIAFSMLPSEPDSEMVSFVLPPDGMWHLGEVIVSYPQAVIQAREYRHSLEKELALLIIHGILHLLGYEDKEPGKKCLMETRQAEILGCLDVD